MHKTHCVHHLRLIGAVFFTLLLGCSDGGNSSEPPDDAALTRIQGVVVEQISGAPIRDAVVSTDPASEVVRTDSEGQFSIADGINGAGTYRVFVEHFAYNNDQATINVSENSFSNVDFVLSSSASGLHASTSQLVFDDQQTLESLRLSSNIENTGYSILTSTPWLSVTPDRGTIANRETALLTIQIDRGQISDTGPTTGEIVINADNGTRELIITVQLTDTGDGSNPDSGLGSPLGPRQLDCRRPDIFRDGWDWPDGALIQFLESVVLPGGEGARSMQIVNPLLVDSFIVEELGTVTITHVDGTTPASTLDIFELDRDENIVTLVSNFGVSDENRRASITYALLPGVYCYVLRPTTGNFATPENIFLEIGFTPAQ